MYLYSNIIQLIYLSWWREEALHRFCLSDALRERVDDVAL